MSQEKRLDNFEKLVSDAPSNFIPKLNEYRSKKIVLSPAGKRGGKREGSGRPKNENRAYSIQCHPSKIKELREYAKNISKIND